jgi:hypothetical protein
VRSRRGGGREPGRHPRRRARASGRAAAQARVEGVAQPVADQVEAHHDEEDHEARHRRDGGRGDQHLAPLPQHRPEIRLGRLRAEAEEGQARRLQDHPADRGRGRDDDHRHDVRQHLGEEDAGLAHAGEPRGLHEVAPAQRGRRAPHGAGEERDVGDDDRVERVEEPRPQRRHHREREQQVGEGHQHVDDAHQDRLGAPAEESRRQADGRADERGEQRRREAHREAHPRAPDQPREEVAPERVGAEPRPRGEGRQQAGGRGGGVGVGERQEGGRERDRADDGHHREPARGEAVLQQAGDERPHAPILGSSRRCRRSAARLNST